MEPPRRRIPELKQRPKSGNWSSMSTSSSSSSLLKAYSMNNSYHEGLFRELQINVPSETSITSDGTQEVMILSLNLIFVIQECRYIIGGNKASQG